MHEEMPKVFSEVVEPVEQFETRIPEDMEMSSLATNSVETSEPTEPPLSPVKLCVSEIINKGRKEFKVGTILHKLSPETILTKEEFKAVIDELATDDRIWFIGKGIYGIKQETKKENKANNNKVQQLRQQLHQEKLEQLLEAEECLQKAIGAASLEQNFSGYLTVGELARYAFNGATVEDSFFSIFMSVVSKSQHISRVGHALYRINVDESDLSYFQSKHLNEIMPIGEDKIIEVDDFQTMLKVFKKVNGGRQYKPHSRRRVHFKKNVNMSGYGDVSADEDVQI